MRKAAETTARKDDFLGVVQHSELDARMLDGMTRVADQRAKQIGYLQRRLAAVTKTAQRYKVVIMIHRLLTFALLVILVLGYTTNFGRQ